MAETTKKRYVKRALEENAPVQTPFYPAPTLDAKYIARKVKKGEWREATAADIKAFEKASQTRIERKKPEPHVVYVQAAPAPADAPTAPATPPAEKPAADAKKS